MLINVTGTGLLQHAEVAMGSLSLADAPAMLNHQEMKGIDVLRQD